MKQEKLQEVLRKHILWLEKKEGGERANLKGAYLKDANLEGAILYDANLFCAILEGANLKDANLENANLEDAYLKGANLKGTNLDGANLKGAYLDQKEMIRKGIIVKRKITGWEKCKNNTIVKLEIPKGAIVFSINNNECRTNIAKVVDIIGYKEDIFIQNEKIIYRKNETHKIKEAISIQDEKIIYRKGKTYKIKDFDLIYNAKYSTGIYFFRTRKEAERDTGIGKKEVIIHNGEFEWL